MITKGAADMVVGAGKDGKHDLGDTVDIPYLLDQTPLSISSRSRIVATPPDELNEIVAALEY